MTAAEWLNPQPVDAETVAIWADVNPGAWPHTPPLAVFEALMDDDDNWWWRVDSGHHLNLYESAIDERDRFRAALRAVLVLHVPVWCNARNDYLCAECEADLSDATPDCPTVVAITAALDGLS